MPIALPLVSSAAGGGSVSHDENGALTQRSILPGGVRVITEHIPGMRSATFGAWLAVGSRDEAPAHAGSTHFLEHLLFKGTSRRTALEIAEAFDRIGGESNAMTGKEYTCYYARVLDRDLPIAAALILDMVTSATLAAADFDTERGVILEELAMNDDDPSDVAHERFAGAVLGHHPLGRPIGGTPDVIAAVRRDAVWDHYRAAYTPQRLVVTAAGGVDHDEVCALVGDLLADGGWHLAADVEPAALRATAPDAVAVLTPRTEIVRREIEQAHVVLGSRGLRATDDARVAFAVYNAILGGGMSSRLFQEIRERRGLTYSVYSFAEANAETGVFGTYAACKPSKADEVTLLMGEQIDRMASGIGSDELERAKGQLSGSTVLSLEDSYSRMARLGKAELVFGDLWTLSEILAAIDAVSADDVVGLAGDIAARERAVVRVGPR